MLVCLAIPTILKMKVLCLLFTLKIDHFMDSNLENLIQTISKPYSYYFLANQIYFSTINSKQKLVQKWPERSFNMGRDQS